MNSPIKPPEQLRASIERFERCFWSKQTTDRPPVAVVPERIWTPIDYRREPFPEEYVTPEDVRAGAVATEYEACAVGRGVVTDDWMPFSAAWRGVPWLEAICGCRVRHSGGSLSPERFVDSPAALAAAPVPASDAWLGRLRSETARLAAEAPADCWISTSIFRGCADVLAAMRGLDEFCLDLHDNPEALAAAAARVKRLHASVLDEHFRQVPPKLGGYGHIFGYWAPGPTTVLQEDIMGLCSPGMYRDLFKCHTAELAARVGRYTLFHLHSTGYRHFRHVLDIPSIAGLQMTVEASGPPLRALVPALREILERSRLILLVDGHFEDLSAALRALPREGLYLAISSRYIADEESFRSFVRANLG